MQVIGLLAPFVLIGVAVIFIAFSGGPGRAREAYLTRGGRAFRVTLPLLYVGLGVAVPALVIASKGDALGGTGRLRLTEAPAELARGKELFRQTCASCHSLAAVNAHGVTGPNLDKIGPVNRTRVLNAIRIGGTGQARMPAGLLQDRDAADVGAFVARVAGE